MNYREKRLGDEFIKLGSSRLSIPVDVYTMDDSMTIDIAIANFSPDSISIGVDANVVSGSNVIRIQHYKQNHNLDNSREYITKSISNKDIDIEFEISYEYDISDIKPKYHNGVLTIMVEKQ